VLAGRLAAPDDHVYRYTQRSRENSVPSYSGCAQHLGGIVREQAPAVEHDRNPRQVVARRRRQRDGADLDLALVERRSYLCTKGHGSSSTISKPYDGGPARPFARTWQLPRSHRCELAGCPASDQVPPAGSCVQPHSLVP
jgi:hypothetical protein